MMNDESHTLFANTFDTAFLFTCDEMKYGASKRLCLCCLLYEFLKYYRHPETNSVLFFMTRKRYQTWCGLFHSLRILGLTHVYETSENWETIWFMGLAMFQNNRHSHEPL